MWVALSVGQLVDSKCIKGLTIYVITGWISNVALHCPRRNDEAELYASVRALCSVALPQNPLLMTALQDCLLLITQGHPGRWLFAQFYEISGYSTSTFVLTTLPQQTATWKTVSDAGHPWRFAFDIICGLEQKYQLVCFRSWVAQGVKGLQRMHWDSEELSVADMDVVWEAPTYPSAVDLAVDFANAVEIIKSALKNPGMNVEFREQSCFQLTYGDIPSPRAMEERRVFCPVFGIPAL